MNARWGAGAETMTNIERCATQIACGDIGATGRFVYRAALHDLQSAFGSETRRLSDPAQHQNSSSVLDRN